MRISACGYKQTSSRPKSTSALPPQQRTFRGPRWTSGFDPKEKFAVPEEVEHWSLTALREKLINIRAKVVTHGRYVTFQLAEVTVPRNLFRKIVRLIDNMRPSPTPA